MKASTAAPGGILGRLIEQGVRCPDPHQVFVEDSVQPTRIAPGVILHPGTRLRGVRLSIGPDSVIGAEGPATVEDCVLGHGVQLKGGFFSGAVFLDGSAIGSAAHVRPGTLLEEQAEAAHAVGFKQTLLLPFVVTGSLVNFCDILMAGGTSRRDHSEVGSSYVHFNYTPHGDKATASLVGDVPRGVMLNQPRIFLGGQGGLVGPARIAFGTVVPAGQVVRGDVTEPGLLLAQPAREGSPRPFRPSTGRAVTRVLHNNLIFIGNLYALHAWYRHVRRPCFSTDPFRAACAEAAETLLHAAVEERVLRLAECVRALSDADQRTGDPVQVRRQQHLVQAWPALSNALLDERPEEQAADLRDPFLRAWSAAGSGDYLATVRALPPDAGKAATAWLDAIAQAPLRTWESL